MSKQAMVSTFELDKAEVSQVLVRHLTDAAVIRQLIAGLQEVSQNKDLLTVMSTWIEYTSSRENHEDFVKRESSRPIGYTRKIRIVLAIANDQEADLVIVANRELVTVHDLFHLDKFLTGESTDLVFKDAAKQKYSAFVHPQWGVPSWDRSTVHSRAYQINLTEFDPQSSLSDALPAIAKALLLTLEQYGSKNGKILIEENDLTTGKLKSGVFDENKHLLLADAIVPKGETLHTYEAGIVVTDLADMNEQYTPCLTPLFPVTLSVTKYKGVMHSIRVSASEQIVHPQVLEQFVNLFCTHMEIGAKYSKNKGASFKQDERLAEACGPDLLERIQSVVAKYPNRIAISDADGSITYAELNRKSDLIAKKLVAYGVNPGDKVIASLDQTVELVVLLVAIVKAGGTYIPLDPNYPLERITFVMEDSQATHIITRMQEIPSEIGIQKIAPRDLMEDESDVQLDSITLPATAPHEAYIIYTSGTTGKPKGVLVPSKNIGSLIDATQSEFKLNHQDVWTMFHSASFDFSVWEMWGCLLTGGHLVVVPRDVARSPYDFYDLLVEKKVTVLNQTPSAFYALIKVDTEQRQENLTAIRLVIFGGEALDTYKLTNWLERYPVTYCRLVNMYGITETTVHVTYRNILHRDSDYLSKSVGVALPGWKISIRDAATGTPCLYGMEGEIWVGGVGLTNGYLNRDELTNQRFVIDPQDGQRWYRSGDLGRMRPDGSVDYLGRIDNQVKLRGFRIELDEIRSVIQKMPFVRNVAVVLHDGEHVESAHKQIVAFIESAEPIHADTVRNDLKSKMPEYMIPARFVRVNEIPMTINGKVDKAALVARLNDPEQDAQANETNSTGDDAYLSIWNKVLGRSIGPDDNFFEHGGNSLMAVELLSALKRELDSSLTLRELLIHSSPNALKEFLAKKSVR